MEKVQMNQYIGLGNSAFPKEKVRWRDVLFVFVLFEPNLFFSITILNYLYFALIFLVFCYLVCKVGIRKCSPVLLLLVANRLCIVVPTVIYSGDIAKSIYYTVSFVSLYLLFEYYYQKDKLNVLIVSLQSVFLCYLIINLVLALMYPDGFGNLVFFLGYRTRFTDYAFALIIISALRYTIDKKNNILFLCVIVSVLNLFLKWIATGLFAVGFFFALLFFGRKIVKKVKRVSFRPFYWISLVLTYLIVRFNIQEKFSWFIETVLHKNANLTFRTMLWENSIQVIKEKIVFGHGLIENNGNFVWNGWTYTQAHNQILQSMYECGAVGTILLFAFIYFCCNKLKLNDKRGVVLGTGVFVYLIIMIVEIYMYYMPTYSILFLAYFMSRKRSGNG